MPKQRIQVYTDPETKRRIDLAAAKYKASVTAYCFAAIQRQLAEDDVAEHIDIPVTRASDHDLIADLRSLREKIQAERGGQLLDLDTIFDELHDERDRELFGGR